MVADIQGQFNNDVTNFVAFHFAISVEIEFLNYVELVELKQNVSFSKNA